MSGSWLKWLGAGLACTALTACDMSPSSEFEFTASPGETYAAGANIPTSSLGAIAGMYRFPTSPTENSWWALVPHRENGVNTVRVNRLNNDSGFMNGSITQFKSLRVTADNAQEVSLSLLERNLNTLADVEVTYVLRRPLQDAASQGPPLLAWQTDDLLRASAQIIASTQEKVDLNVDLEPIGNTVANGFDASKVEQVALEAQKMAESYIGDAIVRRGLTAIKLYTYPAEQNGFFAGTTLHASGAYWSTALNLELALNSLPESPVVPGPTPTPSTPGVPQRPQQADQLPRPQAKRDSGGCSVDSNGSSAGWLALVAMAALLPFRRRRHSLV